MPWIGFVFLMGHMSANQLKRQFVNAPGMVDITGRPPTLSARIGSNYYSRGANGSSYEGHITRVNLEIF